jgi:hypothetical protein
VLTFPSITGQTHCCGGTPNAHAGGMTGLIGASNTNVSASGGISGVAAPGRQLVLAGSSWTAVRGRRALPLPIWHMSALG